MVTKIIADSLKPKLSETISKEKFGFLANRQILDAIGTTQECIHSVKIRNISSVVMKLDLAKAYDKFNWDFLRLLLLEQVMRWIMASVSTAKFSVLINGSPTSFFRSSRGLRKGFPLSPLLFLLIIEGLCRMISKSCNEGLISGINFSDEVIITHFLFVDDVILFGLNNIKDGTGLDCNPLCILSWIFSAMLQVWKSTLKTISLILIRFIQSLLQN